MNEAVSKRQLREFGIFVGIFFPIIIGWIVPSIGGHLFRTWTLFFGIPLLILGILSPNTLHLPYKFWMKLGLALGWVNSRIILGIIFIFVLEPIALVMRLIGYDPLKLKKGTQNTYKENKKNHTINLKKIF